MMISIDTALAIAIIGAYGSAIALAYTLKSEIRHLDDTKEGKNGLGEQVAELKKEFAASSARQEAIQQQMSDDICEIKGILSRLPCREFKVKECKK